MKTIIPYMIDIITWPKLDPYMEALMIYSEGYGTRCIVKYKPGNDNIPTKFYLNTMRLANVLIYLLSCYSLNIINSHYIPQIPILDSGMYCSRFLSKTTGEYITDAIMYSGNFNENITMDNSSRDKTTVLEIDTVLFVIGTYLYDHICSSSVKKLKRKDNQLQFGIKVSGDSDIWVDPSKLSIINDRLVLDEVKDMTFNGLDIYTYLTLDDKNPIAYCVNVCLFTVDFDIFMNSIIDSDILIL
jgi:hypothetical protein